MSVLIMVAAVWALLFCGLLLAMRFDRENAVVYSTPTDGPRTIEDALKESPERWSARQAG